MLSQKWTCQCLLDGDVVLLLYDGTRWVQPVFLPCSKTATALTKPKRLSPIPLARSCCDENTVKWSAVSSHAWCWKLDAERMASVQLPKSPAPGWIKECQKYPLLNPGLEYNPTDIARIHREAKNTNTKEQTPPTHGKERQKFRGPRIFFLAIRSFLYNATQTVTLSYIYLYCHPLDSTCRFGDGVAGTPSRAIFNI